MIHLNLIPPLAEHLLEKCRAKAMSAPTVFAAATWWSVVFDIEAALETAAEDQIKKDTEVGADIFVDPQFVLIFKDWLGADWQQS